MKSQSAVVQPGAQAGRPWPLNAPWADSVREAADTVAPGAPARTAHAQALARSLGQPLLSGNQVDVLVDGPQTYAAMFEAIDNARDHINIESYIVEAEGPGEELAQRLL